VRAGRTGIREARRPRPGQPGKLRGLFSDQAYERIKEMILTMQLRPGQMLTEAELGAQLGLGRMPVREALQRLAQEDLVAIVPRKGSFVVPLQLDDLQQIFELRLALECLSARLAAERITEEELRQLEELIERNRAVNEGTAAHVRVDRAFHLGVAAASRNEYLVRAVERLLNLALRLLYMSGSPMARVGEILPEYRSILDALRRRDGEAACRAMEAHIEEFRNKVRHAI
jgi:DNA-binding GntR family transcriptional regulator